MSFKRIEDLHALSVHEECSCFQPDDAEVLLQPNTAFLPKVSSESHASQSIELHPFHPLQDSEAGLSRQWLLCPVRAVTVILQRTVDHRKTDQLFVCFLGQPVSKTRLSHWVMDAIQQEYEKAGRQADPSRGACIIYTRHCYCMGLMVRCPSITDLYGSLLGNPVYLYQVLLYECCSCVGTKGFVF